MSVHDVPSLLTSERFGEAETQTQTPTDQQAIDRPGRINEPEHHRRGADAGCGAAGPAGGVARREERDAIGLRAVDGGGEGGGGVLGYYRVRVRSARFYRSVSGLVRGAAALRSVINGKSEKKRLNRIREHQPFYCAFHSSGYQSGAHRRHGQRRREEGIRGLEGLLLEPADARAARENGEQLG